MLDQWEVEDAFHQLRVGSSGVDHVHQQVAVLLVLAQLGQVQLREVLDDLVGGQLLGLLPDLVCDRFWGWSTVGQVVLDTEIVGWTTWIVRSGQDDTTGALFVVRSDDVGGSWRGEDTVVADNEFANAVGGANGSDQLDDFVVIVAAIATNDQSGALGTFWDGFHDGLDEVFGVVGLFHEDLGLLSQARSAWFLVLVGFGGDADCIHGE